LKSSIANCFIPFRDSLDPSIIPKQLNDPFGESTPPICLVAVREVQTFVDTHQHHWKHNFGIYEAKAAPAKGKMFGVLVVRNADNELGYLCTFSGKLADETHHPRFVPSLFDIATNDHFITKGMLALTAIGNQISISSDELEIEALKEQRQIKSTQLQQQLFDCYVFINQKREPQNLCAIFSNSSRRKPPAGAGECATPKLLQYAFQHNMQPLAVAEFWWGVPSKSGDRQHGHFYPACNDKCRPILGYMLKDYL